MLGTVTYGYDSDWGDKLVSYGGQPVVSDEIGNMLSGRGNTYTWEHGRELATLTKGTTTWNYTYDANGMRTSRSSSTKTYNYVYNGSKLTQMTVGNYTLNFAYDAAGTPMTISFNGTVYYYVTNLQGDVVAILKADGTEVVHYTYDAWGVLLSTTGTMAGSVGYYNPLRYRGYVYDRETSLYYLQSRYYDPQMGRFINADAFTSTGQGLLGNNMFAYCENNPVNYSDPSGYIGIGVAIAIIAVGTIVGGLMGAFSASSTDGNVVEGAIEGCLTGAAGTACGLFLKGWIAFFAGMFGGASIDFVTQVVSQYVEKGNITWEDIDLFRIFKTGLTTGTGSAIPAYNGAATAADAFGTALMWVEASALITCADIVITRMGSKVEFFEPGSAQKRGDFSCCGRKMQLR